ncbi:MAG TPA: 50S ribosomal protein L25/general stress protein Ctc [Pseudomonadales bacterium]
MSTIEINAKTRSDLGKGASRRLRHSGQVPAIVYGAGEPAALTIEHRELWKAQQAESFYSSVLTLNVDGKPYPAIIKDLQRHPAKEIILHADFQRIDDNTPVTINVPLHFLNTDICHGVKLQGGNIQLMSKLLKVRCLPAKLPAYIEVDMKDVKAGQMLHLSDIALPEGVQSADLLLGKDHDHPVVQVNAARGGKDK